MKNFQTIEFNALQKLEENFLPFWERRVTLIVFTKAGFIGASKSVSGKKEMIKNMETSDTFCCAWTGHYSTDIFLLTKKDLMKFMTETQ